MRVVFLGTPDFAVPSLSALLHRPDEYQLAGVITQPDRPAGRGQRLTSPPVKLLSKQHRVPLLQCERLRDNPEARRFLRDKAPELLVVVAFGQILDEEFFNYPPLGSLNLHPSLLPKYRGAAPVIHTLLNGETETGVSIMKIDQGMDSGDILSQKSVSIDPDVRAGELGSLLADVGAELLIHTIPGYARGEILPQAQDHGRATDAPRISKEERRIHWDAPAEVVHNQVRALNPWPVARSGFRGGAVRVWRTQRISKPTKDLSWRGQPGLVACIGDNEIVVECGAATFLSLKELQLPDRKRLSAADFVNGTKLRSGEVLV